MKPSFALHNKREQILAIAAQYGAHNVRVFGSVARGEDTEASDLDLLVDMDDDRGLSDLGMFAADLRDVLQCKVDAVTSDSLHRLLVKRILREAIPNLMRDRVYLVHIQDCISRVEKYTRTGRQAFLDDTMIQDAVLRNLEIIGEATNNLSVEFRHAHPEVNWRRAIELRNVLIHRYMGVNIGRAWTDISKVLPKLKLQISEIVAALPAEPTD